MRRVLTIVLILAVGIPAIALGDKVLLKSGEVIEGKVITDNDEKVMIQTASGLRTIPKEEVEKVQTQEDLILEYQRKLAEIPEGSADGHYLLGMWCQENDLRAQAKERFEAAIEIDPEHKGARKELGYVLRGGEWVIPKEGEEEKEEEGKPEGDEKKETPPPPKKPEVEKLKPSQPKEEEVRVEKLPLDRLTPEQLENRRAAEAEWKKAEQEYVGVPMSDAKRLEGPGFVLFCNTSEEVALWYKEALTRINKELDRFFAKARKIRFTESTTKITVYRNQQEFRQMTNAPPNVGGFCDPRSGDIYCYHGQFGPTGTTVGVLGHEFTHKWEAMVMPEFRNMPPWIYEGMAVYFGDGIVVPREGKAKVRQIPRDRLLAMQAEFRADKYIGLRELISAQGGPRFTGRHYHHAWSFVYMLVNTGKRNEDLFNQMFTDCVEKEFKVQDLEKICKGIGGIDALEKYWKQWVLKQEVPVEGAVIKETFRSDFARFTIDRPDKSWRFSRDYRDVSPWDCYWFQVAMLERRSEARIAVLAGNNPDHLTSMDLVKRRKKGLPQVHEFVSIGPVNVNGYEAYEIVFRERTAAEIEAAGKKGERKAAEPKELDPSLRKTRRIYLSTVPHFIALEYSAPLPQYDEHAADFDKMLDTFRFHFD